MTTRTAFVSRAHLYSLGTDDETGRHYLAIPVSLGAIDTQERYGLTPEQFERFLADEAAASAFAAECRARAHDDLLLGERGWRRGTPIDPPPEGTPLPPLPARAPAAPRTDAADAIRASEPPAGTWFGPEPGVEVPIVASPHRRELGPLDERVAAVAAAARAGNLSGRETLVELLHASGDDAPDVETRLQAQRLLVAMARDEDFAEPTTFRYLDDAPEALLHDIAGLGRRMQARSSIDVLVRVGRAHWRDHDVRRSLIPSLLMLVDRDADERREEPTLVSLARSAHRTLQEESATYLLSGRPWSPRPAIERMRAGAVRAHASGSRFATWFNAPDLALWSGIPGPYLKDVVLTDADVAAVVAWADALDALPWVDGAKYVHGHDVDGGPSLR